MATGKRYYWIKLKESFMSSDTVDYLMSQPNGANYVVLYQMLCLKTINTDGRLSRRIGEVIIPYDVEKIQRDCKWFSADTIRVALEMYHSFGLIYEDVDGTLVLTDHANLVGSETDWAEKRRRQRLENGDAPALPSGDNVPPSVPQSVPIDIRDKEIRDIETRDIDTRDKSLEIEKEDITTTPSPAREELPPIGIVIDAYERMLGRFPTELVVDQMRGYLQKLDPDVIVHGIELAVSEGVFKWSYVRGVLDKYVGMNASTLAAAQAYDQEYREYKAAMREHPQEKRPHGGAPVSPEERRKQEEADALAIKQIERLHAKLCRESEEKKRNGQ